MPAADALRRHWPEYLIEAAGLEVFMMLTDGRPAPADTRPDDLWSEVIVMAAKGRDRPSLTLRDPDGHALLIEPD